MFIVPACGPLDTDFIPGLWLPQRSRTNSVPLIHTRSWCIQFCLDGLVSTAFLYQFCWTVRGHYSSYSWSSNADFIVFMTSLCLRRDKDGKREGIDFPPFKHILISLLCRLLRHLPEGSWALVCRTGPGNPLSDTHVIQCDSLKQPLCPQQSSCILPPRSSSFCMILLQVEFFIVP